MTKSEGASVTTIKQADALAQGDRVHDDSGRVLTIKSIQQVTSRSGADLLVVLFFGTAKIGVFKAAQLVTTEA